MSTPLFSSSDLMSTCWKVPKATSTSLILATRERPPRCRLPTIKSTNWPSVNPVMSNVHANRSNLGHNGQIVTFPSPSPLGVKSRSNVVLVAWKTVGRCRCHLFSLASVASSKIVCRMSPGSRFMGESKELYLSSLCSLNSLRRSRSISTYSLTASISAWHSARMERMRGRLVSEGTSLLPMVGLSMRSGSDFMIVRVKAG